LISGAKSSLNSLISSGDFDLASGRTPESLRMRKIARSDFIHHSHVRLKSSSQHMLGAGRYDSKRKKGPAWRNSARADVIKRIPDTNGKNAAPDEHASWLYLSCAISSERDWLWLAWIVAGDRSAGFSCLASGHALDCCDGTGLTRPSHVPVQLGKHAAARLRRDGRRRLDV